MRSVVDSMSANAITCNYEIVLAKNFYIGFFQLLTIDLKYENEISKRIFGGIKLCQLVSLTFNCNWRVDKLLKDLWECSERYGDKVLSDKLIRQ